MIYPPIDKLVSKVDCKFELAIVAAKRAHQVLEKRRDALLDSGDTLLTYVAKEIFDGKVTKKYYD